MKWKHLFSFIQLTYWLRACDISADHIFITISSPTELAMKTSPDNVSSYLYTVYHWLTYTLSWKPVICSYSSICGLTKQRQWSTQVVIETSTISNISPAPSTRCPLLELPFEIRQIILLHALGPLRHHTIQGKTVGDIVHFRCSNIRDCDGLILPLVQATDLKVETESSDHYLTRLRSDKKHKDLLLWRQLLHQHLGSSQNVLDSIERPQDVEDFTKWALSTTCRQIREDVLQVFHSTHCIEFFDPRSFVKLAMIAHPDHVSQMETMERHVPIGHRVLCAGSCFFLCSKRRVPELRHAFQGMIELQHLRVSVERMGGLYQTSWIAFVGKRIVRSRPPSQTQTLNILSHPGMVLVRLRFSAPEVQKAFDHELRLGDKKSEDQKLVMSAAEKVLRKVRCGSRSYAKPPTLEIWCIYECQNRVDGFIW